MSKWARKRRAVMSFSKKRKIILWAMSLIVPCFLFSFPSSAQELVDYKKPDVHYIKADIDKDGAEEEISVVAGELESGQCVCVIKLVDDDIVLTKAIEIDTDISCNLSIIEIHPSLESFIGINYGAGAHSNILVLFKYTDHGGDYYTLDKTATFASDRPSIKVVDIDDDGVKEIVTVDCDYEINPVEEDFIIVHKYVDDGKWKQSSVFRTATKEYMPEDWDKDKTDTEAYKANMKKFGMHEPEGREGKPAEQ